MRDFAYASENIIEPGELKQCGHLRELSQALSEQLPRRRLVVALGRELMFSSDDQSLAMWPGPGPCFLIPSSLCSPDGYLYEREAILEYILHQKKEIARQMKVVGLGEGGAGVGRWFRCWASHLNCSPPRPLLCCSLCRAHRPLPLLVKFFSFSRFQPRCCLLWPFASPGP